MGKLFINSIDGLTTEKDFDTYFAPKNGQRANEINIGRPGKRLKKELNIVQDMLSVLVNREIREFDADTVYQYGEIVQVSDLAGDVDYIQYYQSQIDDNIAIHPHWTENETATYWKEFDPFGTYSTDDLSGDYKNDVKMGYKMHNSGYFIIGERLGRNIAIDRDEISARTYISETEETYPSILRLQSDGGILSIHGNLWESESEKHRVSVFTDDGRFILGNKETINTDDEPHPYDNCFKFECWGDALITEGARIGGWVTFDKGFKKVPSITVQDGEATTLTDRLVINPSTGTGNIEMNALQPLLDKGSTLYLQNNPEQIGDIIVNSGTNVVHITNEGRIGVKKVAPDYQVDVRGQIAANDGDNSAMHIINNGSVMTMNTCVDRGFYINAYQGVDPEHIHIQNAGGDTYFNCIDNIIHLTSTGRIGIGVENPSCALDVSGNSIISGGVTAYSYGLVNNEASLKFETRTLDYNFRIITANDLDSSLTTTLYIQDGINSDVIFNGDDSSCLNSSRTVHISDDGDMGIGCRALSGTKLKVNGTSTFTDKITLTADNSSDTAIETNGRIRASYFDGSISNSEEALHALTADTALFADKTGSCDLADLATKALTSETSDYATVAGSTEHCQIADLATKAETSDYATLAGGLTQIEKAGIAERYSADNAYPEGTVLTAGGINEVTIGQNGDPIVGVVVYDTAFKLNENDVNMNNINPLVLLKGKCKCLVNGVVNKGQYVVLDSNGKGKGIDTPTNTLSVVGIAIDTSIDGKVTIKV